MKKLLLIHSFLILSAPLAFSQVFTTVTGTAITDSSGQLWSNLSIVANLQPPHGSNLSRLTNQGFPITDNPQYIFGNAAGSFSFTVDDNVNGVTPAGSFWRFSVCSNTSAQCTNVDIIITGPSQDISATINAALVVPRINATPAIQRSYSTTLANGGNGALFWRTTDNTLWGCQTTPNLSCSPGWVQIAGTGTGGTAVSINSVGAGSTINFIDSSIIHYSPITGGATSLSIVGPGISTDCLIGTTVASFAPCPGTTGGITGATPNGGLVQTGSTLGMLTTCTSAQFLSWNGTAWVCTSLPTTPVTPTVINTVSMVATQNGVSVLGPVLPGAPPLSSGISGESFAVTYPNYTGTPNPPGFSPYFGANNFFSTASTASVVGVSCCFNGNNSVFPILGFSTFTMKFLINPYGANTRYWWGLANANNGSTLGSNNLLWPAGFATDTPNKTFLGWRASGGVDTNIQAVMIQANNPTPTTVLINTGIPVDLAIHTYAISLTPTTGPVTTVTWSIDGTTVATNALVITTTLGSNFDLLDYMFWIGDNKNTSTLVGGVLYYATMQLLR